MRVTGHAVDRFARTSNDLLSVVSVNTWLASDFRQGITYSWS